MPGTPSSPFSKLTPALWQYVPHTLLELHKRSGSICPSRGPVKSLGMTQAGKAGLCPEGFTIQQGIPGRKTRWGGGRE